MKQVGADFFLICTNTMHKVAEAVEKSVAIPLVHIADATGELLVKDGIKRVGLLGTRFTMEQAFYKNRLSDKFGIDVVIPDEAEREVVHQVMYTELCLGQTNSASRNQYLKIISSLHNQGAEAVILGCTEIALLVQQTQTAIPLYDTTEIHAQKAVKLAIGE
ncbi:aspartate/glutamate racemase family protein [Endozoicomonas sp. GU-1]|uniref:aspartate/glutamate racemase family protein n=1 Tax=Endozoicomonas sp. GU-1 TaxID=3009078 RepID=UPI003FA445BC